MANPFKRLGELIRAIPRIEVGRGGDSHHARSPVATYYLVVVPALVLAVFGLMMGFSSQAVTNIAAGENPYIAFLRPLGIIVFSLVIAFIVHLIPTWVFRRSAIALFLIALGMQVLVITPLGRSEGGNVNWVHIPGVPFLVQPSEFLKLALVLVIARAIDREGTRINDWKQIGVIAGLPIVVALGDVMLGHDMGTAMIVAAAAVGAVWMSGIPGKWFFVLGTLSLPALAFLVASNPTRMKRIEAILPWNTVERDISAPEQIDHSLWAFGSGGLMGLGPGASREKWNYLQAAHTDFILAIIGEEFGLLGTLAVLIAIGMLVWGMVRVCQDATDPFVVIATGGVATWIGVQAVVNVLSVTGIGPVIGVPLPLVSYGGSSFLFTAVAVGVVASFARTGAGMRMMGSASAETRASDPRIEPRRRGVGRVRK